ncbi:MAG: hypothetical protein QME79_10790 [Bacillota bacterium]|nr:hypothetical protein [Bacillota bacterium]
MPDSPVAAGLRARLADQLKRAGYLRSPAVEEAFLAVPRHLFVPAGFTPEEAYRDEVIPLIPGLATLSQPSIVVLMLEEAEVRRGMKVLEIGTASGYNAALLAELAGDPSLVYTIEIDPRLAAQARRNLEAAGYGEVNVRTGDGTRGWPDGAPYDRVVVTAEATDLSRELLGQLDPDGLLLTPFAIPGLPALLLRLRPKGAGAVGTFVGIPVAFVPLQGEYTGDSRRWEAKSRRVQRVIAEVEDEAWSEGVALSLDRRLALYLVAAAVAEKEAVPPDEQPREAWRRYIEAGEPELADVGVLALPLAECPNSGLVLRRRDYAFRLDLPRERNGGGGGESPRREVVR